MAAAGSEKFASDPEVSHVLIKAAREKDTRRCFLLLGAILDTPGLADRLLEALRPEWRLAAATSPAPRMRKGGESDDVDRFDWSDFYLICFAVGFCFSFFSFVFGGSRFGRLHLPHFHGHGVPHLPAGHGPMGHAPVAGGHAPAAHGARRNAPGAHQASRGSSVSPFNPPSLAAFLAWFGGTGYLLTRFSSVWVGLGLLFRWSAAWLAAESFSCS